MPSLPLFTPSAVVRALRAAGCVFAEDEADLLLATARTPGELAAMVERRAAGIPLEHVVGWARFHGLRIAVEPGVFVPRRRTEFLIDQALAQAPGARVVADLCCGSGALGVALAAALGAVEVHAADIDPAAVRCAHRNLAPYGGRAHLGDLFDALPAGLRGRVGVLTANVPYVPSAEVALLPAEARDHEPGGCLLTETSERQAEAALRAFADAGLTSRLAVSEELYAHVVIGVRER